MATRRYFIDLAYDGTNYHGWQVQPNGSSVQQCVEEALSTLLRQDIRVTGAGRTDTGVHALLMVAHFDVEDAIQDTAQLTDKLNRLLPPDISVYRVRQVNPDAHARFDALTRTYKYYLTQRKHPFARRYRCRLHHLPDFDLMNRAAGALTEYSDFSSFSKLHSGAKTNNCRVTHARWEREDEHTWVFTIQADRFLRNMVRAIVGTLLEVGRHKLSVEDFRLIIEQKDRGKAGTSAPAHALFLVDITYPDDIFI